MSLEFVVNLKLKTISTSSSLCSDRYFDEKSALLFDPKNGYWGEGTTVGNLNLLSTPKSPRRTSSPHSSRVRPGTTENKMAELNLEQILETTETIVQELLATGEFG